MNTVNLPRAAVSILKVIDQTISPTSQSSLCCTAFLPPEPDQCNRIANWISLTTGLEQEIGVTESWEVPEFREFNEGAYQKVCFFMLSCLILKSSVARGIPSLAAAPFGPATFPLLSARAASMSSFS